MCKCALNLCKRDNGEKIYFVFHRRISDEHSVERWGCILHVDRNKIWCNALGISLPMRKFNANSSERCIFARSTITMQKGLRDVPYLVQRRWASSRDSSFLDFGLDISKRPNLDSNWYSCFAGPSKFQIYLTFRNQYRNSHYLVHLFTALESWCPWRRVSVAVQKPTNLVPQPRS